MNPLFALLLIAANPLEVDVVERLGEPIPPDLILTDHRGVSRRFDELGGHRPLVLALAYYRCPMLCSLVLNGIAKTIAGIEGRPGRDFDVVTVSFDPDETSADAGKRRSSVIPQLKAQDPNAWPFYVGDEPTVAKLLSAIGMTVVKDPSTGQWSHPAVFLVLTPDGRISRYFYGFDVRPFDLELALAEAGRGESGPSFAKLLLRCFSYDPATRRYGVAIATAFRAGGAVLLLLVGGSIGLLFLREKRRRTS